MFSSKVKIVPKRSEQNFSILNCEESPAIKFRLVDYYDMQEDLHVSGHGSQEDIKTLRPEQLNVEEFIYLTNLIDSELK